MRYFKMSAILVVALMPLLLASCGSGATSTVSGIVIMEGKPVASGAITFIGTSGIPVTAEIQPDGRYRAVDVPLGEVVVTLIVPPQFDEVAVGKAIKNSKGAMPPPPKSTVMPERYSNAATSDLKLTVKAGENAYDPPLKK